MLGELVLPMYNSKVYKPFYKLDNFAASGTDHFSKIRIAMKKHIGNIIFEFAHQSIYSKLLWIQELSYASAHTKIVSGNSFEGVYVCSEMSNSSDSAFFSNYYEWIWFK